MTYGPNIIWLLRCIIWLSDIWLLLKRYNLSPKKNNLAPDKIWLLRHYLGLTISPQGVVTSFIYFSRFIQHLWNFTIEHLYFEIPCFSQFVHVVMQCLHLHVCSEFKDFRAKCYLFEFTEMSFNYYPGISPYEY